jgi:hypothetical protein
VRLRPNGTNHIVGVDGARFTVYLADECLRISTMRLHGTLAHLLLDIHRAVESDDAFDEGVASLSTFLRQQAGGASGGGLVSEAVTAFAIDCGCDDVVRACKDISLAASPAAKGAPGAASQGELRINLVHSMLRPLENVLTECLLAVGQVASRNGDGAISAADHKVVMALKRHLAGQMHALGGTLSSSGWCDDAASAFDQRCAAALVQISAQLLERPESVEARWQAHFLHEVAVEAFSRESS